MSQKFKKIGFLIAILIMSSVAGVGFAEWVGPSASPPDEDVPDAVNVGSTNQTKAGSFTVEDELKTDDRLVIDESFYIQHNGTDEVLEVFSFEDESAPIFTIQE